MSRQQGLTLLEMLVAVAILAIILTTVAPGIQNIVIKNRITSDLNNLSAVIQRARFSAVDEQGGIDRAATITLCPNNNDANYASALLLSLYGRISVAVDSDDNGKKEDLEGNELNCS